MKQRLEAIAIWAVIGWIIWMIAQAVGACTTTNMLCS